MLKKLNKRRNKKGFTLVELVVVIAILGIIAAIAVPKLSEIRDESRIKADAATAAQIASAARIQDTSTGKRVEDGPMDNEKNPLDPQYMANTAPQSGGSSFDLEYDEGNDLYKVSWEGKIKNVAKSYIVTEGKPFDMEETP